MKKRIQKGKFIAVEDFDALVYDQERDDLPERIRVVPTGVYINWDYQNVWLNYTGDDAQRGSSIFAVPSDGDFLREMAAKLIEIADELYPEK